MYVSVKGWEICFVIRSMHFDAPRDDAPLDGTPEETAGLHFSGGGLS